MKKHRLTKETKKKYARNLRDNPTFSEKIMWELVGNKKLGITFRKQVIICGWIVDLYCAKYRLIIEIDGGVHKLRKLRKLDALKDKVFTEKGYIILRFTDKDVIKDPDHVILRIIQIIST